MSIDPERWPAIHPFLLGLFPILFFFAQNAGQLGYGDMLVPTLFSVGLAGIGLGIGRMLYGNWHKGAVVASLGAILFFSYGHVWTLISGITVFEIKMRHDYLLPLWTGLFVAGAYAVYRTRWELRKITGFLNVASVAVVAMSLVQITFHEATTQKDLNSVQSETAYQRGELRPSGSTLPNIYYVVPDGYASSETLSKIYGFNNDRFLSFLNDKGFHVENNGISNYALSFLSLASSLNMTHLRGLARRMGRQSDDRTEVYRMLRNSRVLRNLEAAGYTSVHFRTVYGPTSSNRFADVSVSCGQWWESELYQSLIKSTLLYPFWTRFIKEELPSKGEVGRTECKFNRLQTLDERLDSPIFAFAHIIPPHPPLNVDEKSPWKNRERYIDRLQDVNQRLKRFVRKVTDPNPRPSVVIIQSDHGPKSTGHHPNPLVTPSPSDTLVRERMGILNAYHLPGNCKEQSPNLLTPVNSFRIVMNCYFDTEYNLLPNRSYISSYKSPYQFTDVTEIARWPLDPVQEKP